TLAKLRFYGWQVSVYVPIVWAGLLGLIMFPREIRRERWTMLAMLLALAIQVLNLDSDGGCQFGPRFLLPWMPYASLGLLGFYFLTRPPVKAFAVAAIELVAVVSFGINLTGALYVAMSRATAQYGRWPDLVALRAGARKPPTLAIC